MENERNHKEKYPFETFLKDREKSTRELALEWWKSLSNYVHENAKHSKEYYFTKFQLDNFTIAMFYNELTGREIEQIYHNEVIEPKLQEQWQESQVNKQYTKPNQKLYTQEQVDELLDRQASITTAQVLKNNSKQFKEGNDALFKAYINKFSQEYKTRMLQILIDDLGVRSLVDESLRSK